MKLVHSKWKVYVSIVLVTQIIFTIALWKCSLDHKPKWKRIHAVINSQFVILLNSVCIWHRVIGLLKSSFGNAFSFDIGRSLLFLLLSCCHLSHACFYFLLGNEPHLFSLFCFVSFAIFVHFSFLNLSFLALSFIFDKLSGFNWSSRVVCWLCKIPCGRSFIDNVNNNFHQTLVCIVFSLTCTFCGFYLAAQPPKIISVDIWLKRLPDEFNGFRIALLSDVHIGPMVGRKRVEQVVTLTNRINADLIAISGDLVDGAFDKLFYVAEPLRFLKSKRGIFFATGNHEYYYGDVEIWLKYLSKLGITVLHNSNAVITSKSGKSSFCLAGVDDFSATASEVPAHSMNLTAALVGCDDKTETVIVLCHQPKGVRKLVDSTPKRFLDLILAGHTHAGQMLVIFPLVHLLNPFFAGLYQDGSGTTVYVSAGVFFGGAPVKVSALEITNITLRSL